MRQRNGQPVITDGPFAETKEYLGGLMFLEARDLNEAIQIMSKHPSLRMGGTFEIRPSADLPAMVAESKSAAERKTGVRGIEPLPITLRHLP